MTIAHTAHPHSLVTDGLSVNGKQVEQGDQQTAVTWSSSPFRF
jgi:hypothetical protein